MKSQLPHATVIWTYTGGDHDSRQCAVESLDYPGFKLVPATRIRTLDELSTYVHPESQVCIFWADDGKPVAPDFLRRMVDPLVATGPSRAAMHLWSGNALAVPRETLGAVGDGEMFVNGSAFMKFTLMFLDVDTTRRGVRKHVAFSSTERLAPLCGDPLGLPS